MPLVSHKTLHEAVCSDFKAKSTSTTFSIGLSIRINTHCCITFVNKINLLTNWSSVCNVIIYEDVVHHGTNMFTPSKIF